MGMKVRLGANRSIDGRNATVYPACDHCGEIITPDTPSNCEFEEKDGAPVYFLHKACTNAFRSGKPKMLWSELVSVHVKTK